MNNNSPISTNNFRNLWKLCLLLPLLLLMQLFATAQYSNVPVTGYNADVVGDGATGAGINSTTADVDGVNWIFVSTTFNPGSGICASGTTALPANNLINSLTTSGLVYTLQPYNANNSLRLPSGTNGTFTLTSPTSASNIYLLALGGSGACTVTSTITFTDLSTQTFVSSIADWCSGVGAATTQFYRINRNDVTCTGSNCQYLYEANLVISPTNYGKTIASINIASTGGILNVMGVASKAPCLTPSAQPTALTSGTITTGSIGISFTAATPAPTGYLVVRYPQGSTPTPPSNGTFYSANQVLGLGNVVDTSTFLTSFTANGLSGNSLYDFYVYSYNSGTTCGGPIYRTTTPLTSTIATAACSGTLTGTVMIGPGLLNTPASGYTSITNALVEIGANGLAGNTVLELQTGYDGTSTNETFPIAFPNHPCLSSSRTLTIRPASGVSTALTITSSNAGATLNFNGGDYITIDGRAGGAGTSKFLNVINTSNSGAAIQFTNDARNNTVTYCDIQGQNTSATTTALCGVIYFGAANTTLLSGNDNNTISFSNIHATAGGTPTIAICSYGSTTSTASWNENNSITDNNIYDFFSATTATTGIKLENGSHAFTISNNRFYQSVTRNYTTGVAHRILWLTPNTSNASSPCAFQVLNNFIGGNNPAGTGTYTLTGTGVYFWGMDISHWGTIPSSIQGNTITNISVASTITGTTNDFFRGISTGNTGNVNIGTITGNIIGSGAIDRAIILSTTGTGTNAYGIKNGSTTSAADTINIYNNIIGGITDSTTTATNAALFYGIGVTSGSYSNIVNNTIGSTTVPNSITLPNPATAVQTVIGINVVTGLTNHVATITGNTIANINNGYVSTSTTSLTRGIAVLSSAKTIVTGNSIYNIKTASTNTGSATTACLMGIIVTSGNLTTVIGNTIHSLTLSNPTSTTASFVEGIYISANGGTPTHSISKNFIHSFDITSPTNTNAAIVGMDIAGGANILSNNIIRLGIKPDGTDLTNAILIRGIFLNTVTATNVYHNSIYIGGSNVGNVNKSTMAFQRNATGPHDIRNNIFVNNRSNATLGAGGKHYQLFLNATTTATLNNNVYYGVGNDVKFATPNGGTNDSTTYSLNWALSGDVGSTVGDPQFIAPNGNASSANLHIHPTNPSSAEAAGTLLASVTDDIDGDIRATNTPNDAGADAGNFTGVNMIIDSTVATQITTSIVTGSLYQQIIGIRMYSRNAASPLQVSSFGLNTGLTSTNSDIENARVYYTGSNATFDTASTGLYGTLPVIPNGAFSVTGTRNLIPGVNYFWLAYDVKNTATAGNLVDARVDNISIVGGALPNILYGGDPAGTRTIKAPMNGNYNVGVGQTYTTLTSAMSDLSILGVSGPVKLTLKDALYNTTSGEIFPITLGTVQGVSATNTVTIVPEVSVASRIEANNATAVLDLNGAKYVVIDGRQGGVGTFVSGNNLQIANTGTAGPAVRFINEASFNKLRYVDLKSNNGTIAAATSGVVNFGTTTGVNGNDTNLIEYCDVHEDGSGLPLSCISSIGSATTVAANNDGNIVTNCNIYNFFAPATGSAGIYVGANNGGWVITNNHIYQTALRTYTNGFLHRALWITPNTGSLTSASGFTINNNYIGGNAANGTGSYTMAGAVGYVFYAMDLSLGLGTASNIQGNIITNINLTASNTGSTLYGINIATGNILCGTTSGNIVGSTTTNGAITFTSNSNGGSVLPYRVGGGSSTIFRNNIASGISLTGSSATIAVGFYGMNLSGGTTVLADSNYIGYPTLANSITLGTNTSTTASVALGIITNTGAATSHSIIGNYIGNITNNYSGAATASSVRALHVAPTGTGVFVVSGNKIEQIINASPSTGTAANAANHAITVNTTTATSITITRNIIRSVNSSSATGAVVTNGIYYAGPTSGNHIISRNLIHSISPTALNPSAVVVGIDANSGNVTVANNMIRLGIDSTGTAAVTAFTLRGISKTTGNARVYFNTIYIGGTGVGTDINRTFAFVRAGTGIDTVRNNIFINQRTNGSAIGGGHFAASLNNATTLAMDFNLLRADSIGVFNNLPQLTLTNWKGASGIDANTVTSIAGLINPTGSTSSLDLHIQPATPTPIEGSGTTDAGLGLSDDFDGEDRATLTPTDIGADAGNFIANDIAPPTIAYTALSNTPGTTDRSITATINDATGIYLIGALRPRIYFKKQASGTYVSAVGTFVSGTKLSSVWNFTITSSTLGGVASNDSIYYYIIAQDSTPANNIGSFPGGVEAVDVNTITTHPGNPSKYWITPTLSGIYTVGNTVLCNYSTLTQAINLIGASFINGPVVLELMDPLYDKTTETFPIVLPSLGFTSTNTLTIRPGTGVTTVIRDSITHAVLDLNGVDYLTIDGRQGGVGTPNSLTIENRSISNVGYGAATVPNNIPNAIRFINDATNNTLKYINIRGANGTNESGVIFFSTGTVVGNSYNTIDHCDIGNVTGVANPFTIFCGVGSTDIIGKFNRNNVISNNNIFNFFSPTGESNGFKISKGNTAWTISGNNIYQTNALVGTGGTQYIMNLNRRVGPTVSDDASAFISLDSMVIIDNIIGGSGPNASGATWSITGVGPNFSGIYGEYGKNSTIRISRNTFTNFDINQNTTGSRWVAINLFNGIANIDSNIIGTVNGTNAINMTSTINGTGITAIATNLASTSTQAGTIRISYNKIGGITINGNATTSVNFTGINISNAGGTNAHTYRIEKNTIGNDLANNIITTGASTSATTQYMIGINNNTNSANMTLKDNIIQNMTNTYTGTAASLVHGINLSVALDTITGNYISNLTNAAAQTSTTTTNTVSVVGIQASSTLAGHYIAGNTIRNLWNTASGAVNTGVIGINANGIGSSNIAGNTIYGLGVSSTTGAFVYGTSFNSVNNHKVYNNMIALGLDTTGSAMLNTPAIAGINKLNTGSVSAYHNTINIQGNGVGSGLGTTAAYSRSASGIDTLISNILINTRNNASTGGAHYSINLNNITTLTSHHNLVHVGPASAGDTLIGLNGSIGYETLPAWNTFSSLETFSKDSAMAFVSNTNLHLDPSVYGAYTLIGATGSNVLTDIDGQTRSTLTPYMGADEIPGSPLPVRLISLTATTEANDVLVSWATASESNNKGFDVERSVDGKSFETAGFVKGAGNSNKTIHYNLTDADAFAKTNSNVLYYRLKQIDRDGATTLSKVVVVSKQESTDNQLSLFPNPVANSCTVSFTASSAASVSILVSDVQGRVVSTQTVNAIKGNNATNLEHINRLETGVYFVNITINGDTQVLKLIKQ